MKALKITVLVLLAVAVASCCSCRTKSKGGAGSLTANNWQVIQLDGDSFTPQRAESYTLQFGVDNRISGVGDCNRLMGGYTWDMAGNLSFEQMAGTRMFCPDQQSEDKFMKLLADVDSYSIDGNTLMLMNGGRVVMILKKI